MNCNLNAFYTSIPFPVFNLEEEVSRLEASLGLLPALALPEEEEPLPSLTSEVATLCENEREPNEPDEGGDPALVESSVTSQARSTPLVLDKYQKDPLQVPYQPVTTVEEAREILARLTLEGEIVGLDLETTGLYPQEGAQARLLQIAPLRVPVVIIDLFEVGGLEALKGSLCQLKAVAHNAAFEMKFLKAAGISLTLDCTLLAHHTLTGKMSKLSELTAHYLDVPLDKSLQVSSWEGSLTTDQLTYAAADAYYTRLLFEKLMPMVKARGSERVYTLCKEAQPTVVTMELTGMPFDVSAHGQLLEQLRSERDDYSRILKERLPTRNMNSNKQLGEWLTRLLGGQGSARFNKWPKTPKGHLATGEKDFKKGMILLPSADQQFLTDAFLPYKEREKQITSFGDNLKKFVSPTSGRIHAHYKMAGTRTGRFSCSSPNLQQIPRDRAFRALFKAPEGRIFVIADYSQMELRVAAMVAKEETLLKAYREGQDTHAITAGLLLHKKPEDVTKQERQLAKAVNFGLLYGQGARGLKEYAATSYNVEITESQAKDYRDAWFKAYPAFATWHYVQRIRCEKAMAVTTPLGRKRVFTPSKEGDHFSATKAYNTPVQGGAAEVMLAALGKLPQLLAPLDATPLAVIHDEIIVESAPEDAPQVMIALEQAMVAGMLDVFPQASTRDLVEAKIVSSWAGK